MHHRRLVSLAIATAPFIALACHTRDGGGADAKLPASSSSSAGATSASTSTSTVTAGAWGPFRCVDGVLDDSLAHDASQVAAAPSASASGSGDGWGDGIGLGSVGALGHGGVPLGGLVGELTAPTGKESRALATSLCERNVKVRSCVVDAQRGDPKLKGTLTLALTLRGGEVTAATSTATALGSPAFNACVAGALTGAHGSDGSATYALTIPRKTSAPIVMIETGTTVTGRLPPEVVRRIVRANFPRFRQCFARALETTANLSGTVSTTFVIDKTGAVKGASSQKGTITDATMRTCVAGVFSTLSFPEPEGGEVNVTYPIEFRPPETD